MKQAEAQRDTADSAVTARMPETYQWLLVPGQASPQAAVEWQAVRLSGQDALAVRASKKLRNDESLVTSFAPSRLRMDLDRVPLWRGDHVAIKQLVEDFARYHYLSRLKDSEVLLTAIRDGLGLLTWEQDAFAYADGWDEAAGRYRGLRAGVQISGVLDTRSLLVKPEVATRQLAEEARQRREKEGEKTESPGTAGASVEAGEGPSPPRPPEPPRLRRFHGSIAIDPARVGRDAGRIAEEIVQHLVGLANAEVEIHLEIQAHIPGGAPENVVRTVSENCKTLKFKTHGFEEA